MCLLDRCYHTEETTWIIFHHRHIISASPLLCCQHPLIGIFVLSPCLRRSFIPISSTCDCFACRKHTRAYIHHMLDAHEMLALVLLDM